MIPIPNLPTDSLYKFMFVSGLIMILTSFYLMNQNIKHTNSVGTKIDSVQLRLDIDSSLDTFLAITYDQEFKLHENRARLYLNNNLIDSVDKELIEMKKSRDKSVELLRKNKRNSLVTNSQTKLAERTKAEIKFLNRLCIGLIILGLVFFVSGVYTWFYNIQSTQDRMTQIQLEMMEIELQKAKNPKKDSSLKYPKSSPPFYKLRV